MYRVRVCLCLLAALVLSAGRSAAAESFEAVTRRQQEAIDKALAFLARTQNKDGSWYARSGSYANYPVAMTSLAGMALLAGGNTPGRGRYGAHVARAVGYLIRQQDASGLIHHASGSGGRPMYGHGFATQFLSQVYGMTRDPEQEALLRGVLTRAVALTSKAQADNGGWYYTPNTGADEGSVTITQVQGLRACRNVGIEVSYSVIKNAINYVKKSQNEDGSVNYSIGTSSSGGSPALTAAGLEVFNAAGAYGSKEAQKALEYISKSLKRTVGAYGHEVYFVYYASQGIFLAGDEVFREYWPTLRDQMLSSQHPDGSFPGDHVGEIYGTAMYAISLQLPFEYLPLYQR